MSARPACVSHSPPAPLTWSHQTCSPPPGPRSPHRHCPRRPHRLSPSSSSFFAPPWSLAPSSWPWGLCHLGKWSFVNSIMLRHLGDLVNGEKAPTTSQLLEGPGLAERCISYANQPILGAYGALSYTRSHRLLPYITPGAQSPLGSFTAPCLVSRKSQQRPQPRPSRLAFQLPPALVLPRAAPCGPVPLASRKL